MATIDLITYDQKLVTPKDDALIHQFGISNGILYGCEVTIANSNTLHITGGQGIIYGRQWEISEGDITVTLPASGSLRGRLYVKLDLSNTTNPIELLVQTAVTLPDLTDDDQVNVDNSVSELEICTFDVSSLTISNLVRTVSAVADGSHADVVELQNDVAEINSSLNDLTAVDYRDYFTLKSGFSISAVGAIKITPKLLYMYYTISGTIANGQTVIANTTSKVIETSWGIGRVTQSDYTNRPATTIAVSNGGEVRTHTTTPGISTTGCLFLIISD